MSKKQSASAGKEYLGYFLSQTSKDSATGKPYSALNRVKKLEVKYDVKVSGTATS
jgi:hypothetical protein